MTLPFIIGGARAVIPGVYDKFRVQDSLTVVAPAGRNVVILGESEEGIPSDQLDLQFNFFTSFKEVQDFYKKGSIVDAARQLFTTQPDAVFGGSINRLYVWKTNATTRAEKIISSPSNYGSIVAARFGEAGNFIKSQIKTAQAESKPTTTFTYHPSTAARTLKVSVDGVVSAALALPAVALPATGTPAALVTALNTVTGILATGGAIKVALTGTMNLTLSASGGDLTLTKSGGAGLFNSSVLAAGDSFHIPLGGSLSGALDQNAGSYEIVSCTSTVLVLRRKTKLGVSGEIAVGAFDLTAVTGAVNADVGCWAPITVAVTAATPTGAAASLEIAGASGALFAAATLHKSSALADLITASAAAVGKIAVAAPAAGQLTLTISQASWSRIPKAGEIIWIKESSMIAGAGLANVGAHIVTSASANSISLQSCFALSGVAVASANLNGVTSPFQVQQAFVSTSVAGVKINSSAERKVKVEASRTTDGEQFPATAIGGRVAMEISYWDGIATAASLTIDQNRKMTISFTGGPVDVVINMRKYASIGDLADYIATLPGFAVRTPDAGMKSLPSSSLDMVTSVGILGVHSAAAYNGRLKVDYYDWKQFFADNFGLLSFKEGTMVLKAGLPDAESSSSFLSGAAIGASSNQSFQDGLDAALKVNARIILPCVSRDSRLDIEDALTDENSTYTIDSVNAAVKAHVATASATLMKKERFGLVSFMGSFEDSITKVGEMGYERIQVAFQMFRASNSEGSLVWFQPWMGQACLAAGRVQAKTGTPMLRKAFQINAVKHLGDVSVYSDSLVSDFDPNDQGQLSRAIEAGLLVWNALQGTGIVLVSQDLTSRSKVNDPQGWVYERASVLFACDEYRDSVRTVLENVIGKDTIEVSRSTIDKDIKDSLDSYVKAGSLIKFAVTDIRNLGNGWEADYDVFPPEAVEFIGLTATAKRNV